MPVEKKMYFLRLRAQAVKKNKNMIDLGGGNVTDMPYARTLSRDYHKLNEKEMFDNTYKSEETNLYYVYEIHSKNLFRFKNIHVNEVWWGDVRSKLQRE